MPNISDQSHQLSRRIETALHALTVAKRNLLAGNNPTSDDGDVLGNAATRVDVSGAKLTNTLEWVDENFATPSGAASAEIRAGAERVWLDKNA